jgi:hypothetical protein
LKIYEPIGPENFDEELHSIFIGHGVTLDLKVMGIYDVPYIDTQAIDKYTEGAHQTKKLKLLCSKYLNAQI